MDENNTTPVFLFTGFVESGKTTMIKNWLIQDYFREQPKIALIVCEDGFTEFDHLDKNVELFMVENKEDFNEEFLEDIEKNHTPTAIIIEHNCMVSVNDIMNFDWPENWELVEVSAIANAQIFQNQMKNMYAVMSEQIKYASTVVFNRCDENTSKLQLRGLVKAVNPEASLLFIDKYGNADESLDELPFDINAPVIKIEDIDYGLWFIDIFDNPQNYDGKTVQFKGKVARPKGYPDNSFLTGRYAMTCCANDMAYLKLLCVTEGRADVTVDEWVTVTAGVQVCQPKGMDEPSPVFYVKDIQKAEAPESEYVFFS